MAISFVAVAGNPGGSDTNDPLGSGDGAVQATIVVSKPVGTAENDIMVGGMGKDRAETATAITQPTNWTERHDVLGDGINSSSAWRKVGASEPATHTWSGTYTFDEEMCAATVTWTNAESTPIITSDAASGSSNTPTAPTITPGDGAGLFAFIAFDGGDGKPFGPSSTGYDERADMDDGNAAGDFSAAAYTTVHGTGATGTKAFSASATDGWHVHHIGVDPAAAAGDTSTEWWVPFAEPQLQPLEAVAY